MPFVPTYASLTTLPAGHTVFSVFTIRTCSTGTTGSSSSIHACVAAVISYEYYITNPFFNGRVLGNAERYCAAMTTVSTDACIAAVSAISPAQCTVPELPLPPGPAITARAAVAAGYVNDELTF